MSEPFIGEIGIIAENFEPQGWFFCNGQTLPITGYTVLYAVIGTVYGGDGRTTFNLPDLRGRAPICQGQGTGLTQRPIGIAGGKNTATLGLQQLPSHTHTAMGTNATGISNDPTGRIWAKVAGFNLYSSTNNNLVALSTNATGPAGSAGTIAHDNVQPCLGINFVIAYEGVYPTPS